MSNLSSQQIDEHVRTIVASYLKDVRVRPQDEPVIKAGTELVINLLQNINDIAYYTRN